MTSQGKPGATAKEGFTTRPTAKDPYSYQHGLGNRFSSEAIPNILPLGWSTPQKVKYGLYSEQLNGTTVVAPRHESRSVWMYRIRPSVAHGDITPDKNANPHLETCFLSANPKVEASVSQQAWDPFPLVDAASDPVNFVQGIRSVAGKGDASLEDGLAIHIYSANASMDREAFCNCDGEMLILPQQGRLEIQTELGNLMVRPSELIVIPAGIRFRVRLPDGPSRGYIQELFAAHHEAPERGPVGVNGMALERDFKFPVASFDIDEKPWTITYKMGGQLHSCTQNHSPFDVVAWFGNLVPYKYNLGDFINLANVNRDQADPTIYCVLRAPGKDRRTSRSDFLVFTEKWLTAEGTFRPPYYHRNMSTEIMGLIFGEYGGSSHVLAPGGLSYEASYMPHGETYETWRDATDRKLEPVKICKGTMAFMFHVRGPMRLTSWALHEEGAKTLHPSSAQQWDSIQPHFLQNLEEINTDLKALGLHTLAAQSG